MKQIARQLFITDEIFFNETEYFNAKQDQPKPVDLVILDTIKMTKTTIKDMSYKDAYNAAVEASRNEKGYYLQYVICLRPEVIVPVEQIVSCLTEDQQQLIKDIINEGAWGNTEMAMVSPSGEIEEVEVYGYITGSAAVAGHFSGRQISAMCRSIYNKLCSEDGQWQDGTKDYDPDGWQTKSHMIGQQVSHYNKWVANQNFLFIRSEMDRLWEEWSRK